MFRIMKTLNQNTYGFQISESNESENDNIGNENADNEYEGSEKSFFSDDVLLRLFLY